MKVQRKFLSSKLCSGCSRIQYPKTILTAILITLNFGVVKAQLHELGISYAHFYSFGEIQNTNHPGFEINYQSFDSSNRYNSFALSFHPTVEYPILVDATQIGDNGVDPLFIEIDAIASFVQVDLRMAIYMGGFFTDEGLHWSLGLGVNARATTIGITFTENYDKTLYEAADEDGSLETYLGVQPLVSNVLYYKVGRMRPFIDVQFLPPVGIGLTQLSFLGKIGIGYHLNP